MMKKITKYNIYISIAACVAQVIVLSTESVSAQSRKLTIAECRVMAVESSQKLRSSREQQLVSEDLLAAYRANHLPNFSLNGGYLYSPLSFSEVITGGYLPTFVPDATGALVPNVLTTTASGETIFNSYAYMPDQRFEVEIGSVYSAGVRATQPIYMGGKIRNAIKLAELGVDVSRVSIVRSEAEIREQCDVAFYNVVKVEEMLLAAEKYEQVVAEFLRQMQNGVKTGMKRPNDLMKVEVRHGEAKLMKLRAENGLRLAKMNLCYTIGLPLTTSDIELVDAPRSGVALDSRDLDVSARPEVALLELQIEAREREAAIIRSDFLPSVSAIASYSYLNGGKFNGETLFNSASFSGGVMANVPLFHWGEGRRKQSAKRREVTIAEGELADLSQKMTLELLQSINNYNEALLEVEITAQSVLQAEENMRLGRVQYEAGMETIADYLEAQALWQEAQTYHCRARAELRVSFTRYERCRGVL
ncbi:MAG: TolC family protein [Rikenellaceae bacterium]